MEARKTFILGTAVKIVARLDISTATTATIVVDDPSAIEMVSATNMTKEADKVYSYVYQSDDDNDDGDYVVTITVTYGGYTSIMQDKFTLVDQE